MLRDEHQSARMSKITNDGGLNPVWHKMLFLSCTHSNSERQRVKCLLSVELFLYIFVYK